MSKRRSLIALGILLGIAACATSLKYREYRLEQRLKFSHKLHMSEAECSDCHAGVEESEGPTRGQYIGQGDHGGCADCHDINDKKQCSTCHIGDPEDVELTRQDRHLNFSHAMHSDASCETCHTGVKTSEKPGHSLMPQHAVCKQCHQEAFDKLACDTCHRDMHRQGVKPLAQFRHGTNFVRRHGALAQDPARCSSCHDQTYCADCHAQTAGLPLSVRFPEKIQSGYIHRGDFLSRHAAMSRNDPASCLSCHGANFCTTCHEVQGIATPGDPTARFSGRAVHGPDINQPGAPGFHGRLARRNIAQCASCHDRGAASNCVECHRVGGLGGNPHPTNFKWQNQASACRSNGMCAACHMGGAGCQ